MLLPEVLGALAAERGGLFLDGTFGAGGYTQALLDLPGTRVVALDRDPLAIRDGAALSARYGDRLSLRHARFGGLGQEAAEPLAGIVLDIGVSSMQLDNPERGFSFRHDASLDMRMEASGRTAADLLAELDEEDLANIIYRFGEERASRRIARAIVSRRKTNPVVTTGALADLVKSLLGQKFGEIHPATRTFQALRIAVNDELGELARALEGAEQALAPGGRLAVVTFHSLEDRIVKQFLAARAGRGESRSRRLPGEAPPPEPTFELLKPQPVVPSDAEVSANPRARSAKLRAAIRRDVPAREKEGAR